MSFRLRTYDSQTDPCRLVWKHELLFQIHIFCSAHTRTKASQDWQVVGPACLVKYVGLPCSDKNQDEAGSSVTLRFGIALEDNLC